MIVSSGWRDGKLPRPQLLMSRNRPWCLLETRSMPRRQHSDGEPSGPRASSARELPEMRFQGVEARPFLQRRDAALVSDERADAFTGARCLDERRRSPAIDQRRAPCWPPGGRASRFARTGPLLATERKAWRRSRRRWSEPPKPDGAGAFLGTRRADRGPATGVGSDADPFCRCAPPSVRPRGTAIYRGSVARISRARAQSASICVVSASSESNFASGRRYSISSTSIGWPYRSSEKSKK